MNLSHKVDVATVVFEDELPLLEIQARSLARFMEPELIGAIIVYINERQPETIRRHIDDAVLPLYGRHRSKVVIQEAGSIGPNVPDVGWLGQQACKLVASRHAGSPYYLTLDAKHHLIRQVRFNELIDSGRARKSLRQARTDRRIWLDQRAWLADSLAYFGCDPALADAPSPPSCPPFLLHSATTREMIDAIERREGTDVLTFFARKRDLATEFTLYFAWLVSNGTSERYLVHSDDACCTLRPSTPPERRAKVDQDLRSGRPWLLAISRGHLGRLPDADRSLIAGTWTRSGLFESPEFADAELNTIEAHFHKAQDREQSRRAAMLKYRQKLKPLVCQCVGS